MPRTSYAIPLAAFRLELDLAVRSDDAIQRSQHLQRAQDALDRMQRLVTQLLLLARVDKLTELDDAGPLHLMAVADEALRDISERAASRFVELSLDHEGSGLGLSIAQAITALHHGQLEFDRSSLGGAQVRLTLPGVNDA